MAKATTRIGTTKSGWCLGHPLEQQHEDCPYTYVNGRTCGCDCHTSMQHPPNQ